MPEPELDEVVISDASAIRALAHPARLAVTNALFEHSRALTATQAAKIAGVSPSAMSYHLRALEKAGIIKHAPDSNDGRERPWVRAGTSLAIRPRSENAGAAAATDLVLALTMETDRKQLLEAVKRREDPETRRPLDSAANYYRTTLVVNADEAKAFFAAVQNLSDSLRVENRSTPPKDAELVTIMLGIIPEGPIER